MRRWASALVFTCVAWSAAAQAAPVVVIDGLEDERGTMTVDDARVAAGGLDAGLHWVTGKAALDRMARMDARSRYIRLEARQLHDELFGILRFTRDEVVRTGYGLDFESLGVPFVFVLLARQLRHWSVNRLVSRLGLGRLIARMLAARLRTAGALCLVTVGPVRRATSRPDARWSACGWRPPRGGLRCSRTASCRST